jgi:hypothetical protein
MVLQFNIAVVSFIKVQIQAGTVGASAGQISAKYALSME